MSQLLNYLILSSSSLEVEDTSLLCELRVPQPSSFYQPQSFSLGAYLVHNHRCAYVRGASRASRHIVT